MAKKPLSEWRDEDIESLINNYRARDKTEGGHYTLAELLLEQRRRLCPSVSVSKVVDLICEQSRKSHDGLTTYGELFAELFPGEKWIGNEPRSRMSKILDSVIGYCVDKGIPLISVLVVRKSPRRLDDLAKEEIVRVAKSLGVKVVDEGAFFEEQVAASKTFAKNTG